MAISYLDTTISLEGIQDNSIVGGEHATYWPLPTRHHKRSDCLYSVRIFSDTDWQHVPTDYAFYFHGSGGGYLSTDAGGLVEALIAAGIVPVQVMQLGYGNSSANPFQWGYGNVNAPAYRALFIKSAIWVENVYQKRSSIIGPGQTSRFVFVGQSMGSSACLAWFARMMGGSGYGTLDPRFKGLFLNGATVGGLGNNQWNDVQRNLHTLSGILARERSDENCRLVLSYADSDDLAPPDYARRLQTVMRHNRHAYMVSPGGLGHNWYNLEPSLAVMWVRQLLDGNVITKKDGVTSAVRGATV